MLYNSLHARLLIQDYQACLCFYRDVLGFELTWADGDYASFQSGEMRLAIFKRRLMAEAIGTAEKPADADCQDKVMLIFEVDDVDETHRQLKEKGVHFVKSPEDYVK